MPVLKHVLEMWNMGDGLKEVVVWGHYGNARDFFREDGSRVMLPDGWVFVPSGDGGLTRRLKASGAHWCVVHRRRGRIENLGVCVAGDVVERERGILSAERESETYRRRLAQSRERRVVQQVRYEKDFYDAVLAFLAFAPCWRELSERLAHAVTAHAVPVGSGTVARTETLPLAVRAEAAVIAWMRHQTTCYDQMSIARIKGERRAVRRRLAERSREILDGYRNGSQVDLAVCPLYGGLLRWEKREEGQRLEMERPSAPPVTGSKLNGHLGDFFLE